MSVERTPGLHGGGGGFRPEGQGIVAHFCSSLARRGPPVGECGGRGARCSGPSSGGGGYNRGAAGVSGSGDLRCPLAQG